MQVVGGVSNACKASNESENEPCRAHIMRKRGWAYTYSVRVPFGSLMARRWNVFIMQSACLQCCGLHGSCELLAVSPQQPSRATDATQLTPAEGIIASASLAGHD